MRKVILNLALTLDGFIEGPNGELDWLVRDGKIDFGDVLTEILEDKDIIFYGRKSYDKWGNFQPDDQASQKLKDAYRLLNSKQKYVLSNTMTSNDDVIVVGSGDTWEKVNALKQEQGKNIWLYGGASAVTTFLNLDLVDELRLAIHPVIIGQGKPLFQDIEKRHKLKLTDVKGHNSGVLLVCYQA